jgi:hypothetical protein
MKRRDLERRLRVAGCFLKCEGGSQRSGGLPFAASFLILNSYFCLLPRGARQAAALGHFSRISRETVQLVSIFDSDHSERPAHDAVVAVDLVRILGAHFTRNFSTHGSIFSPFSSQCLSRIRRCLVAWRSSAGISARSDSM